MTWALAAVLVLPGPKARWEQLLQKHVVAGRVDYDGMRQDRAALAAYLAWVGEAARRPDLAFLLNAYNATVVAAVLDHGLRRVIDVQGFFDAEKHTIAGEALTLNELETKIRKRYADPRIHFALNCAARSCPPLSSRAFETATLDKTLDDRTREFLDGDGVRPDSATRTVAVSKIFEWYRDDFVAKEGSVKNYLLRWVTEPGRRAALSAGYEIVVSEYDWSLNRR